MKLAKFNSFIPLEIGDIIQADGYINKFKLTDIIHVHSIKNEKVDIILEVVDLDFNIELKFNYTDFKWNILNNVQEVI